MIRKRRNAYLAALFMLVGVVILVLGTFVPVITMTGPGLDIGHVSVDLSDDVDISDMLPIAAGFGVAILVFALLLSLTRRRGVGLLWRILALLSLIAPVCITVRFWYFTARPEAIIESDGFSLKDRIFSALSVFDIGEVSPGVGLYLLTLGCLLILVGCFVPSKKSKQLIIDEDDPGFQQYNPYAYQFGQYQAQRYAQQAPPQREHVRHPQSASDR